MRYDVYLAGPMSGLPDWNFPLFGEVAGRLRDRGRRVFNPAENMGGDPSAGVRAEYMRLDFEAIMSSESVVFLPGWRKSRGAKAEFVVARELGLPVYEWDGVEPVLFDAETVVPVVVENVRSVADWSPPGPRDYVDEAVHLVYGDREGSYGHPFDDFSRTALIWSAILGHDVSAEQVALCMVGVKLSREVNAPKADNIVDAHGYLLTYGRVLERRREQSS